MTLGNRLASARSLIVLWLSWLVIVGTATAEAAGYTRRDISGPYTSFLEWIITFVGGQEVGLPTWAIGRFVAEGRGRVTETTFNVGGCLLLAQNRPGAGTYVVDASGRGSVVASVTYDRQRPVGVVGNPCPATLFALPGAIPAEVRFSLALAINDNGVETIGLNFTDTAGNPIAGFGSRGFATRQERR